MTQLIRIVNCNNHIQFRYSDLLVCQINKRQYDSVRAFYLGGEKGRAPSCYAALCVDCKKVDPCFPIDYEFPGIPPTLTITSSKDEVKEEKSPYKEPTYIQTNLDDILKEVKHPIEFEIEACIFAQNKQVDNPAWLGVVSPPSSGKSHDLKLLHGTESAINEYSMMIDSQTDNAMAAGRPNTDVERAVDVFSQSENRTLVYNDLGSMLGEREDKLQKWVGQTTAAYGGQFAKQDTTELRQHNTHMAMIVAMTPKLFAKNIGIWTNFGNRFLILKYVESEDDCVYDDDDLRTNKYTKDHCWSVIKDALARPWDNFTYDTTVVEKLKEFCIQVVKLRTMAWGETVHDLERPHRLFNQLKNLMKSRARLHNRTEITIEDFHFFKRLVWFTIPYRNVMLNLCVGLTSDLPRHFADMCRYGKKLGILKQDSNFGNMYSFEKDYKAITEEYNTYMKTLGYEGVPIIKEHEKEST